MDKKKKESMSPEKSNQITRALIMGIVFDPVNLVGGKKFFTKLHDIARRAGIDDDEFDAWYKGLLQERNSRLSVIPMRVSSEPEDEAEHSWAARANVTQFFG